MDPSLGRDVLTSLLDLGRFEEAEQFDGAAATPATYARRLWDLGFLSMFEERYTDALPYFLRCLAFRQLPKQFSYLQAYLECLACAGRFEQMARRRRLGMQQEAEIAGAAVAVRTATTVRKFSGLVAHEPVFRAHATNPELLDLVEDLIGTPISLYADQALLKPPFVGSEKLPHQDNAYFRVVPDSAVITCWCALDDATVENGCMHYLAGSHRGGIVEHTAIPGTPHLVPHEYDPEKATAVPIKAGGVIFHHSCTLHHSPPNNTPHWRRAFVCHFVRSDAEMPRVKDGGAHLLRLR